jgi:hypothetical protein
MSALLEYDRRVPVSGYEVITIEDTYKTDFIKRLSPQTLGKMPPMHLQMLSATKLRVLQPRSERTKRFDLFEKSPTAFLEFAQTPATEEGIKDFADRYGLLLPDRPEISESPSDQFRGRCIDEWSLCIRHMHHHIELWHRSKKTNDSSQLIRAVHRNDPIDPIFRISPIRLCLKEDPLSSSGRLCIRPQSLHYALWAELLLAIDEKQNLRACKVCRKWFTLEAGRGRSDKEYCSDACRMRAYRKRKSRR